MTDLPRSPALRALHARYIGDDPVRQAEYQQAVEDAREVQAVADERDAAQDERDALRTALARLVAAKDEKDAHGETGRYHTLKQGAWEQARSVLCDPPEPDEEAIAERDALDRIERDAAQEELAEARRLLALDPFFRCGTLLPEAPPGWQHGFLDEHDARKAAIIDSFTHASKADWNVEIIGLSSVLGVDGEWIEDWGDAEKSRYFFPSPAAALAALDAWRAARRAEIAGTAPATQQETTS